MKKKILILIPSSFFLLLVVGFGILRLEPVRTYLWKHTRDYALEKECFAAMPYKCGIGYKATDQQIIAEVEYLHISKQEAINLIREARKEDQEEFKILSQKDSLTEFERFRLERIPSVEEYQKRILQVIEKMD